MVIYDWFMGGIASFQQWHFTREWAIDTVTRVMATCSILHTFLPPWDWEPEFVTVGLSEFPAAQWVFRKSLHNRWYKLLIYSVGFVSVNMRSTIWKFISVKNPDGPNANQPTSSATVATASVVVEETRVNTNQPEIPKP